MERNSRPLSSRRSRRSFSIGRRPNLDFSNFSISFDEAQQRFLLIFFAVLALCGWWVSMTSGNWAYGKAGYEESLYDVCTCRKIDNSCNINGGKDSFLTGNSGNSCHNFLAGRVLALVTYFLAILCYVSFVYDMDKYERKRVLVQILLFIFGVVSSSLISSSYSEKDLGFGFGMFTASYVFITLVFYFSYWMPLENVLRFVWLIALIMFSVAIGSGLWHVKNVKISGETFTEIDGLFYVCDCQIIDSNCHLSKQSTFYKGGDCSSLNAVRAFGILGGFAALIAVMYITAFPSSEDHQNLYHADYAGRYSVVAGICGLISSSIYGALQSSKHTLSAAYILFTITWIIFLFFGSLILYQIHADFEFTISFDFLQLLLPSEDVRKKNREKKSNRPSDYDDDLEISGPTPAGKSKSQQELKKSGGNNLKAGSGDASESHDEKPKFKKPVARIEEEITTTKTTTKPSSSSSSGTTLKGGKDLPTTVENPSPFLANARNNNNNNNDNGAGIGTGSGSTPLQPKKKPSTTTTTTTTKKQETRPLYAAGHPFAMNCDELAIYLGKIIADTVRQVNLDGAKLLACDERDLHKSFGTRVAKAVREAQANEYRRTALNNYDVEATAIWLGKLVSTAVKETGLDGPQLSQADDHDLMKALGSRAAKEVRALHIEDNPINRNEEGF